MEEHREALGGAPRSPRSPASWSRALFTLAPTELQPQGLLVLLGDQAAYDALVRGDPVEKILAAWAPGLAAFAPA